MDKNIYVVTVNYDRSVEDGVKAGKYYWTDKRITSDRFPSNEVGNKEVSIELVHFGKNMKTDEVLSELDRAGLRPATLKELLALGEKVPDLQRESPISALGSVCQDPRGGRGCVRLGCTRFGWDNDSKRYSELDWLDSRWGDGYRFAAVRK